MRRRGLRRRRILLLLAAILLLLFVFLELRSLAHHPRHVAPPPSPPVRHTPRRTVWLRTGASWTPSQSERLGREIAQISNGDAFPASTALLVMDGRDGHVLYGRNSNLPLVPGSTIKLITAAAALGALSAEHRFATSVVSDGSIEYGTLNGSVWLVGGGDPELTSDDLRRGVHVLQLAGIDRISGDVNADGSRYGPDQVSASWLPDDLQYGWAAPASAISIDGGSIQFTITPTTVSEAGVAVDPPGAAERVIASVSTGSADAENTLTIDALPDGSGYTVRGQIPYGAPQKYWRALPHPTRAAAASLLAMLRLAGVDVSGSAGEANAPAHSRVLWQHQSRPLDVIVQQIFFLSDNHAAEELLRAVGWKSTGLGTLHNSLIAERSFLQSNGIPADGVVLADGSGLSAQNKLTAQSLAGALRYILNQPLTHPPYALLPRAGIEGTVAQRELAPEVKGRVFAKDGYIDGASAIAGYVLTAHHGPVIFAFLVNNWDHGLDAVWSGENQILDLIARE